MAETHELASVHGDALTILDRLFAGDLVHDPDLTVRVDALLDRLTGDFDADEAPLRREADDPVTGTGTGLPSWDPLPPTRFHLRCGATIE